MNNAPSRIITSPAWRAKSPGFSEFNNLLNLIQDACLLVDRNRNTVLNANSQFLKLTAFSQTDLLNKNLDEIIPEAGVLNPVAGVDYTATLIRYNREPLQVIFRISPIDVNNQFVLYAVTPLEKADNGGNGLPQESMFTDLQALASITNQNDLPTALNLAVEEIARLTGADRVAVYQADTALPRLNRQAHLASGAANDLPDQLNSTNLVRLNTPTLWLPGKRVASELQRFARIENFSYLASTPIGQEGAWMGLLVIADTQRSPVNHLVQWIEYLGKSLYAVMQHFILIGNLQRSLEESVKNLTIHQMISEHTEEGLILLKPDLTIIEMNPSAELMLGYALEEVISQPVENILIGTESVSASLKSALEGIATHNLGTIKLHQRTGHAFSAHLQILPVIVEDQIRCIIVYARDVSEHEQIRVQTQQLEQRALLGEVTAIFAHEVRNPINNISTGLQLFAMDLSTDDPRQESINRLQIECGRLTHLMESVLSFSKPMEIKMEPIDLNIFLKRILDRWQPRFSHANVSPFLKVARDVTPIIGDPRELERVFTNLISNAVNAMAATGGTLAIKVTTKPVDTEPPQVEITVSDSGPGIPEDIKDRIFEPFVTTSRKGTGLGLAITKRIITAHKGSIKVESFAGGTMFQIFLPIHGGGNT